MMADLTTAREIGFVTRAKRYVFFVEGLPSAKINDIIVDKDGNRALVQSLSDSYVMALALDPVYVRAGTRYMLPREPYLLALGDHLFGRVINSLGEPIDGGKSFPVGDIPLVLDADAPGIELRVPVKDQLYTGCTLVDTLLPIATGQRQLIFGGDHAGKSSFLIDVVRHQKAADFVSIYVLIGKSVSELGRVSREILTGKEGAKVMIIAALSDQLPSRIAIAPSVGFAIAEHFQKQGKDVLVILDDLDAHAKYLREIALLEERLPGRESYPGDLFYQQAHLMERSGTFVKEHGGGSITTLPVVATEAQNFSSIIPTNLMSCTDGHLMFVPELQGQGIYPAINEERSVTRMGRQAQTLTQKQLSARVRLHLSKFRQQREYSQFSVQLKDDVRAALKLGEMLEYALRQNPGDTIPADAQVPLVALTLTPFLEEKEVEFFVTNKEKLRKAIEDDPDLQELRAGARAGMPLDAYLSLMGSKHDVFEKICHS
ncbi:MAG: hypothetical protein JWM46_274 [Candidatus Kaiserbacteria bacterium]|nr:hypothetical protein [Candidatus Kaiserbacteria bacterium]